MNLIKGLTMKEKMPNFTHRHCSHPTCCWWGGLTAPPESQNNSHILVSVTHGKPCGNFKGFLSKSTRSRPQWPKWPILDKNPNFWAWFSKTSAPLILSFVLKNHWESTKWPLGVGNRRNLKFCSMEQNTREIGGLAPFLPHFLQRKRVPPDVWILFPDHLACREAKKTKKRHPKNFTQKP